MLKINIIGAGRVGGTLAKLINQHALGEIRGICNSSLASSKKAVAHFGFGYPCQLLDLPSADITFITVKDDEIASITKTLAEHKINPNSIYVHCSGALPSEILLPLKKINCSIASIHPLKSFADDQDTLQNIYCGLEGDARAAQQLNEIFQSLGAIVFNLNSNKKTIYHVGTVFAANYLVLLFEQSITALTEAGLERDKAVDITLSLMQGNLDNLKKYRSGLAALTGPLKRGDIKLIQQHLAAMDPKLKSLYCVLAKATIEYTELNDSLKEKIQQLLDKESSL